jgi:hypothetical protein
MRRVLKIALATAAIAIGTAATPAAAVTLQACTSGASCVSGTTNVNLGAFNAPGTSMVTGTVGIGGPEVDFTSNGGSTLLETNTGAATIFTASGDLLSQLTFTLVTGAFTAAEFNLENGNIKTMDVVLTTSSGDTKTITLTNANGSNIFDIIADAGESFTGASFSATPPNGFVDFKQLRLVLAPGAAPVPEPATWGMMLLGFAGVGMALRRSRRRSGALMQIA